jgi:hypothetical protein
VYYRAGGTFVVNAAEVTQQVFSLAWLVGTANLRWLFSNQSCAQAGVGTVRVDFQTSTASFFQEVPCTNYGVDGYSPYLYSGTYQVFIQAYGRTGLLYRSSPFSIAIAEGVFPAAPLTVGLSP